MSREHSNPAWALEVLRRMVSEFRRSGAEMVPLAELEAVIERMGDKHGNTDNR